MKTPWIQAARRSSIYPFQQADWNLQCLIHATTIHRPRGRRLSTTPPATSIAYEWHSGIEPLSMYRPGGYHPVMIGDVLRNRYQILDKLGFGGHSTIWLARDKLQHSNVALKIGIADSQIARQEINILKALTQPKLGTQVSYPVNGERLIPTIIDNFEITGPNGTHTCYTVVPAQGDLKEASFSRLFPVDVARALAARLALAVSLVHKRGFVHGDIHLRNGLIRLPYDFGELSIDEIRQKYGQPETVPVKRVDGKNLTAHVPAQAVFPLILGKKAQDFTAADVRGLMLSDFGEAFSPSTEQRLGRDSNTPAANRAPEASFYPDTALSYPADIWSLGTAIWEILGMKFIFSEDETEDEIIAQQIDVLGWERFPSKWRQVWERTDARSESLEDYTPRKPTYPRDTWPPLEQAFEEFVQKYRRKREATGIFGEEERLAILQLIRGMLAFRPEERWTIEQVLESEWMVKWALPSLQ